MVKQNQHSRAMHAGSDESAANTKNTCTQYRVPIYGTTESLMLHILSSSVQDSPRKQGAYFHRLAHDFNPKVENNQLSVSVMD